MDWIKKNFEKFTLILLSLALLGASVWLVLGWQSYLKTFEVLNEKPSMGTKPRNLDMGPVDSVRKSLQKPAAWGAYPGQLFVSVVYAVVDHKLEEPKGGEWNKPITNDWLLSYKLPILDRNVKNEDPDGDGFTNLDEFIAKTDPRDKNSHPPYITKLALKQFKSIPFRLIFKAQPDVDTFQIDTVDVSQPTQFLKVGDAIDKTPFKIIKFESKVHKNENDFEVDESELTIENTEKKTTVVLVKGKVVDSPESRAIFKFLWNGDEFEVKKDDSFTLKPEPDISYKLIDITENEATIQNLKTKEELKIPKLK